MRIVGTHLIWKQVAFGLALTGALLMAAGPMQLCFCPDELCAPSTTEVVPALSSCDMCCEGETSSSSPTWTSDCSFCEDFDWTSSRTPPATRVACQMQSLLVPVVEFVGTPFLRSTHPPATVSLSRPRPLSGPRPEQHSILRI